MSGERLLTAREVAELARRVRRRGMRIDGQTARGFLEHWRDRGIACEVLPGRWSLTDRGRAMFSGWTYGIELADPNEVAA